MVQPLRNRFFTALFYSLPSASNSGEKPIVWAIHQGEDMLFFGRIIERAKLADFFEPAQAVEGVEIPGITGGEFTRFQIASAQIFVTKGFGALTGEKMKTQPAAIGSGNALGLAKKGDEQKKDEISIDLCLQFEIAGEFLRRNLALAIFELKCGVQRMI